MRARIKRVHVLLVVAALSAFASASEVSGTVSYRERMALPPDAVVTVRLIADTSPGEPERMISELRFATLGRQVPLRYTLSYPDVPERTKVRYALLAQIHSDGKAMFSSEPIFVAGNQNAKVDLVLHRGIPPRGVYLDGKWTLDRLNGKPLIPSSNKRPPTITFKKGDKNFGAFLGVNNMSGSYEIKGSNIQVKTGMQTLIGASKDLMDLENDYRTALGSVTSYRITATSLEFLKGNRVILKFRK